MPFADPAENVRRLQLTEHMTVADFGAGPGLYALSLAKAVPAGTVYAIDVQKELLGRLEREAKLAHLSNIHFIWGNLEKINGSTLRDQSVDLVLLSNILFQTTAKYTMLLEAKRILREGGRLAIIDWQDSFGHLGPPTDQVLTAEKATEIASSASFTLERRFDAGAHHYGLIFSQNKKHD